MRRRSLFFSILFACIPRLSTAEPVASSPTVKVPESVRPAEALLIPTGNGASQVPVTHRPVEVVKDGSPGQKVRIALQSEDLAPGILLSIIGHAPGGDFFATPLQEVRESDPVPETLSTSCKSGETRKSLASLSDESLRKLIEIRERKKELLIERLKLELTPALYATFRQQERRLGIKFDHLIDDSLGSDELIARLVVLVSISSKNAKK